MIYNLITLTINKKRMIDDRINQMSTKVENLHELPKHKLNKVLKNINDTPLIIIRSSLLQLTIEDLKDFKMFSYISNYKNTIE